MTDASKAGAPVEPEKTPINPKEENGMKPGFEEGAEEQVQPRDTLASNSCLSSAMSDDDSDDETPVAQGMNLLDQIAVVEHKETLKKLGISQKQKKITPLVAKNNNNLDIS